MVPRHQLSILCRQARAPGWGLPTAPCWVVWLRRLYVLLFMNPEALRVDYVGVYR
jgi:hypothetical protein